MSRTARPIMATVPVDTKRSDPWGGLVYKLMDIFMAGGFNIMVAGPPGSGKQQAVKVAAHKCGLQLTTVQLESWVPSAIAATARVMPSGLTLGKNGDAVESVCMLLGLDICEKKLDYREAFHSIKQQHNVVAVCNDPSLFGEYYSGARLLRVRGFSWGGMREFISKLPNSAVLTFNEKVELCRAEGQTNGNIRRLKLAAETLISARLIGQTVDGTVDTLPHPWFDTSRLMNRERMQTMKPHKVNLDWVASNLISNLSLENAAAASALIAETTVLDDYELSQELFLSFAKAVPTLSMMQCLTRPLPPIRKCALKESRAVIYKLEQGSGAEAEAKGHNKLMHAIHGNGTPGTKPNSLHDLLSLLYSLSRSLT